MVLSTIELVHKETLVNAEGEIDGKRLLRAHHAFAQVDSKMDQWTNLGPLGWIGNGPSNKGCTVTKICPYNGPVSSGTQRFQADWIKLISSSASVKLLLWKTQVDVQA